MKAWMCRELGDLSVLTFEDIPPGELDEGQVRVAVAACGVNFADSLVVAGRYQAQPPLPFTPGTEIAGKVIEVAGGVKGLAVGDRVMGMIGHGGYAEEAVVFADALTKIPEGMDDITAASFAVTYGTSHLALVRRARLRAGETVVVHGAAGGVGLTALQIARQVGASVIATAGGPEKLALCKREGADHLIDYRSEDIRERVKQITDGRGADVIYDPVGGEVFDASLRCIAFEGRILVIGFAGGTIQQIPSNHVMVKNVDIIGVNVGAYQALHPGLMRESLAETMRWIDEGRITPFVSKTYPLDQVVSAIEAVTSRQTTGKVVVTI